MYQDDMFSFLPSFSHVSFRHVLRWSCFIRTDEVSGSSVVKCTLYSDVIGLVLSVFGIHLPAFFSAFLMSFIAVYTVSLLDMQENSLFFFLLATVTTV